MAKLSCKDCKYFIGGGDWALCCSKKYSLCYEDTEICELFDLKDNKGDIDEENA